MRNLDIAAAIALLSFACAADAGALKATKVEAGADHACALLQAGDIKCWGSNAHGQLGLGDDQDRGGDTGDMGNSLPLVDLDAPSSATQLAAGADHTCALLGKGILKCWGANTRGQLGLGHADDWGDDVDEMGVHLPVVNVSPGLVVASVAAGGQHTCAILAGGSVKCWGSNDSGQLGYGDTRTRGDDAFEMGNFLPTVELGQGRTATKITAGFTHTCALLDNGAVKCWGGNFAGQLGIGSTFDRGNDSLEMGDWLQEVDLGAGRTAIHIEAGNDHTCALLDDDSVKCWGANDFGQLGQGDDLPRGDDAGEMALLPFIELEPPFRADRITAGSFHSCAISDRTLQCWGSNGTGQLGLGDGDDRGNDPGEMGIALPAVELGASRTPVQIDGGWRFTCARFANERIKCWGANDAGQLGLGDREVRGLDPDDMGDALPFLDLGSE
jgi:alpha-tubulin suppressor-like RCC1 family protein